MSQADNNNKIGFYVSVINMKDGLFFQNKVKSFQNAIALTLT